MERHSFISHQNGWLIHQTPLIILILVNLLTYHVLVITAQGQVVKNCSQNNSQSESDCISGESWFNPTKRCCIACSTCNHGGEMFVQKQCNVNNDTICGCNAPLYLQSYADGFSECRIDCTQCAETKKCIPGTDKCECPEHKCFRDLDDYCRTPISCGVDNVEPTSDARPSIDKGDTSLPPWGSGLIAVAVVVGIIIFASCFLCLGIFTVSRNQDPESQVSDNSGNVLVPRGSINSVGTESSYLSTGYPYLSEQAMLELLKNSDSNPQFLLPTGNNFGVRDLSSLTGSPVSLRDNSKPVRTIQLVKNSDKMSVVVL